MSWLQLGIPVSSDQAEAMEDLLLALGATSVTLRDAQDEPILEPGVGETPLWKQTQVIALFDGSTDAHALTLAIYESLEVATLQSIADSYNTFCTNITIETLEDKAWEREWLNHFEPIQCGSRLWICPSWHEPKSGEDVNLMLDPGLAFGTGTHETTLLCLQWLDGADCDNKHVLDFGCGSGILGIAALLLGCDFAVFVDNDPQALIATEENLRKNHIAENRYILVHADQYPAQQNQTFDIVMANILAEPLINLSELLSLATKPEGYLVLSGLQSGQQDAVLSAYDKNFYFSNNATRNNWVRLNGQRHPK